MVKKEYTSPSKVKHYTWLTLWQPPLLQARCGRLVARVEGIMTGIILRNSEGDQQGSEEKSLQTAAQEGLSQWQGRALCSAVVPSEVENSCYMLLALSHEA